MYQASQLYGLEAVGGLTEQGLRKLRIQMMKHVRAFAKSPRHIARLKLTDPLQTLQGQLMGYEKDIRHRSGCDASELSNYSLIFFACSWAFAWFVGKFASFLPGSWAFSGSWAIFAWFVGICLVRGHVWLSINKTLIFSDVVGSKGGWVDFDTRVPSLTSLNPKP